MRIGRRVALEPVTIDWTDDLARIDCAYLCDIAVHPTHEAQGLGKDIVARLLRLAGHHRKIILYAVPGREAFYKRFGFRRMKSAMAIFPDQEAATARGYVET